MREVFANATDGYPRTIINDIIVRGIKTSLKLKVYSLKSDIERDKVKYELNSGKMTKERECGMKRISILAVFAAFTTGIMAMNFNIDLESGVYYTSYIKNSSYEALTQTGQAQDVYGLQEIKLRLSESMDNMKVVMDARLFYSPSDNEMEYIIDNAYFQASFGPAVIYAGRQRVKWGTGYFWNPSDKLQSAKDLIDPSQDVPGLYGVRYDHSFGFLSTSVIAAVEPADLGSPATENFTIAAQLYKLVGTADIFINGSYRHNKIQTAGAAVSWDAGFAVLNVEGAAIRYMGQELNPLRILGKKSSDDIAYDLSVGINKTIGESFFLAAEYSRKEWGLDNARYEELLAVQDGILYAAFGAKKEHAALSASYTIDNRAAISLICLYGPGDGSLLLYPALSYVENNNWDASIGVLQNLSGRESTEGYYSMPFYSVVEIKLRAYF